MLEEVMTNVKTSVQKMITSFEHKGSKIDVFSSTKDNIEAFENNKNRVHKDHHVLYKDFRMEKRITIALTHSQKERQGFLTDKRSSPSHS